MFGKRGNRWGQEQGQNEIDLLAKKDQQIRRLQVQLQEERNRADKALRMIESLKQVNGQSQKSSEGLRSQITRRIKAQQQIRKLKLKNQKLQKGIMKYIKMLQKQQTENAMLNLEILSEDQ